MKKHNSISLFLLILVFFGYSVCLAQELSSKELIENAKIHDAEDVIYQGEVIGDIMPRGKFAWLNVQDDYAAIGIWAPRELVKDIIYVGSYKSKGDYIEIEGKFNRACSQHGGELDIHATGIKKLSEGFKVERPLSEQKQRVAFLLLGLALCLGILQTLRMRR